MRIILVPGSGVVLGVGAEAGADAEVVRVEGDGCWGGIFGGLVRWSGWRGVLLFLFCLEGGVVLRMWMWMWM